MAAQRWEAIDEIHKPKLEISFDIAEQGEIFYIDYAKLVGFDVWRSSTIVDKFE